MNWNRNQSRNYLRSSSEKHSQRKSSLCSGPSCKSVPQTPTRAFQTKRTTKWKRQVFWTWTRTSHSWTSKASSSSSVIDILPMCSPYKPFATSAANSFALSASWPMSIKAITFLVFKKRTHSPCKSSSSKAGRFWSQQARTYSSCPSNFS